MYGRIALLGVGLFSVTLFSPASRAVDVYTDPVGFYQVPALTNSDTFVSLPFLRIPEFRGKIASVLGNILTIAGPQSWSANQWSTVTPNGYYPYFLLITSGTKAGAYYTITNSTASALSVIQIPEDLSGVAVNDQVQVIPFATLGYVFPGGTGVVATTSLGSRKTEVLAPNISGLGINLGYSSTYFFFNSAWRKVGANVNSNYKDTVFLPDQYVVIRQNNGADTTQVTAMGQVALSRIRIPLYSNSFGGPKQDNFVGLVRPSNYSLDQSGLTNAFTATTSLEIGRAHV